MSRPGRIAVLALSLFCISPLFAQTYVTAFDNVKYGRAAGPVTSFGSFVNVEAVTGSVNVRVPMGPGIGFRGARFLPVYEHRISPNSGSFRANLGFATRPLVVSGSYFARVRLPDGDEVVSGPTSDPYTVPNPGNAGDPWRDLLNSFGFTEKKAFVEKGRITSKGYLLLDVVDATGPRAYPLYAPTFPEVKPDDKSPFSQSVIVVSPDGETAYCYDFLCVSYRPTHVNNDMMQVWGLPKLEEYPPGDPFKAGIFLIKDTVKYELASIHDRYGDSVDFEDSPCSPFKTEFYGFPGYKATAHSANPSDSRNPLDPTDSSEGWVTVGLYGVTYSNGDNFAGVPGSSFGTSIPTQVLWPPENYYTLGRDPNNQTACISIPVYDALPDFFSEIKFPDGTKLSMNGVPSADSFFEAPAPTWVETFVEVTPGIAPGYQYYYSVPSTTDPLVHQFFSSLGRFESLVYHLTSGFNYSPVLLSTIFMPGKEITFTWKVDQIPDESYRFAANHIWGVVNVHEKDTITLQERDTSYTRTYPGLNSLSTYPFWSDGCIDVMVNLPDSSKHHVVAAIRSVPAAEIDPLDRDNVVAGNILNTRSHPIVMEETFAPDSHRVTRTIYSAFSTRTDFERNNAVPAPTHIESIDYDLGVATVQDKSSWSPADRTWLVNTTTLRTGGTANTMVAAGFPTEALKRSTTRTMDNSAKFYLMQREKIRLTMRSVDATGDLDDQSTLSQPEEEIDRVFLPGFNSVKTEDHQRRLRLNRDFGTGQGQDAAAPKGVTLTSLDTPGAKLSGSVGADYTYDSQGHMRTIAPRGVMWSLGQTPDVFGRPADQTDANGNTTSFTWDEMSRVKAITPPSGTASTGIVYSGGLNAIVTVTPVDASGAQVTTYGYNGFGQLNSILRPGGGKKQFVYKADTGALSTESVWSSNPNGSQGTTTDFDYRGRLIRVTDPNNVTTTTVYSGLSRTVMTGALANSPKTIFRNDVLGRLATVYSMDPNSLALLSQVDFKYNLWGKMVKATQTAGTSIQTRTWTYDSLGWLKSRTDPETGTTSFSDFDVNGNPWTSNRNGQVVYSTFDSLSRLRSMNSAESYTVNADGSRDVVNRGVDLAFTYDNSGVNGNGKLVSDSCGGIMRTMSYSSGQGLLASLGTTLSGVDASLSQAFEYDSFGNRKNATLDARTTTFGYDASSNLPKSVSYRNSGRLAGAVIDPVDWTVQELDWYKNGTANGVTESYTYDPDRVRVKTMTPTFTVPAGWYPLQSGWTCTYDACGRLLSDGQDSYKYDSLSRLKNADVQWKTDLASTVRHTLHQAFAYDGFGNLIQASSLDENGSAAGIPSTVKSNFSFSASDPAISAFNRLPASLTDAGYDAQGNLVQVDMSPGGSGGDYRVLKYDALGRVWEMSDKRNGGALTERYFYTADGLRSIIEEYQGGLLVRKRVNIYNDLRQLVGQWVME